MTNERKRSSLYHSKIRTVIVAAAVCLLVIVAIINFVSQMAKYNELQAQKELLRQKISDANDNIEELEYWIDSPMDDDYIMKFAREKLDLYRSDEIVFSGNSEK